MKNTLHLVLAAVALGALAGCATVSVNKEYVDPNPFAEYGPAMKSTAAQPLGSYWQQEHAAEVAAATTPEALGAYLASAAAAEALLAKVGPAYTTDPIVLTQIGAISQLVMTPNCKKAPTARKLWVAALERALEGSADEYRKAFFRDQLRWCGFKPVTNK